MIERVFGIEPVAVFDPIPHHYFGPVFIPVVVHSCGSDQFFNSPDMLGNLLLPGMSLPSFASDTRSKCVAAAGLAAWQIRFNDDAQSDG
jgi:hypothetical protein